MVHAQDDQLLFINLRPNLADIGDESAEISPVFLQQAS